MSETLLSMELSTDCTCEDYDEETGECSVSDYCYGCYDDDLDNFKYSILKPWLEANTFEEDTNLIIRGSGMTWQRLSGYAYSTPNTIIEKLSINGDWRLVFELSDNNKTLKAIRYSHDEPTGTGYFTFEVAPEDEE